MGVERREPECWAPDVELKHVCSRVGIFFNWLVMINSIVDVRIRGMCEVQSRIVQSSGRDVEFVS